MKTINTIDKDAFLKKAVLRTCILKSKKKESTIDAFQLINMIEDNIKNDNSLLDVYLKEYYDYLLENDYDCLKAGYRRDLEFLNIK